MLIIFFILYVSINKATILKNHYDIIAFKISNFMIRIKKKKRNKKNIIERKIIVTIIYYIFRLVAGYSNS